CGQYNNDKGDQYNGNNHRQDNRPRYNPNRRQYSNSNRDQNDQRGSSVGQRHGGQRPRSLSRQRGPRQLRLTDYMPPKFQDDVLDIALYDAIRFDSVRCADLFVEYGANFGSN
ncbi:unnamed protein product, partial [Didymodactylos carnosus]